MKRRSAGWTRAEAAECPPRHTSRRRFPTCPRRWAADSPARRNCSRTGIARCSDSSCGWRSAPCPSDTSGSPPKTSPSGPQTACARPASPRRESPRSDGAAPPPRPLNPAWSAAQTISSCRGESSSYSGRDAKNSNHVRASAFEIFILHRSSFVNAFPHYNTPPPRCKARFRADKRPRGSFFPS